MNKKTRIMVLLLCSALALTLLSGCNSKPSGNTSGSGDAQQSGGQQSAGESASPPKVLRVGMECDFPPHNWTQLQSSEYAVAMPDGTYADGYDVQIAKIVADKLGWELQVSKIDWDGLSPSLTSNKIDLIIAGMTDTEERRMAIDFTDVYWSSDLVIVVMKDGPYANAKSLKDFTGAKITAQMDTLHYDLIDMIPDEQKQQAMSDFPTMLMSLSSGKIDGYVAERPAAISAEVANSKVTFIAFEGDNGFGEEMPVSIGLRQNEDELKQQINGVLAGISQQQRQKLMEEAVSRQPLQG